jgi:hypothetical protein
LLTILNCSVAALVVPLSQRVFLIRSACLTSCDRIAISRVDVKRKVRSESVKDWFTTEAQRAWRKGRVVLSNRERTRLFTRRSLGAGGVKDAHPSRTAKHDIHRPLVPENLYSFEALAALSRCRSGQRSQRTAREMRVSVFVRLRDRNRTKGPDPPGVKPNQKNRDEGISPPTRELI